MRRGLRGLLVWVVVPVLFVSAARGEDISAEGAVRENRSGVNAAMLFDMDLESAQKVPENAQLTFEDDRGIAALYLILDREYGCLTLTDDAGREAVVDSSGVLHCYLDLEALLGGASEQVSLCFSDGAADVNELRLFSAGDVPGWVQRWDLISDGGADMVLFSTHGDDEQLFFAGLLPWYAAEKEYRVQVVYFTDHRNMTSSRVHEMLNGLWAVGVRDYPVFGPFPDYYTFDMADAYRFYEENGFPEEMLLSFVVEQLRRFRPLVAVGHDKDGEYGHGMHKLYADLLSKAVQCSADPEQFPVLAETYGVWDVPKTYLHLYSDNPIVLDWDIPLERFQGQTAYEVTRDLGFASHVSQQKDFAWYFRGVATAAQVPRYNPCQYGLYRSYVGEDIRKNDFFENLGPKCVEEPLPPPPTEGIEQTDNAADADMRGNEERVSARPIEAPKDPRAEMGWLIFPAVGTAVLAVMTTCLNLPRIKKKKI